MAWLLNLTRLVLLLLLVAAVTATPGSAATFVVTTPDDLTSGSCTPTDCSLRDAVTAANAAPGPDVIEIPSFAGGAGGAFEDPVQVTTTQLTISDSVVIRGTDRRRTTIEVELGQRTRIFSIEEGISVALVNLGINRGFADIGGGILNRGTLRLEFVSMQNNAASRTNLLGDGGAIYNAASGSLNAIDSIFADNGANFGGAIYNNGGVVHVEYCGFSNNVAIDNTGSSGGAVRNWQGGKVTIGNSLFSLNRADAAGGALRNLAPGVMQVFRSAFVDNEAPSGAVVASTTSLTLVNNTLYQNTGITVAIEDGDATLHHNALHLNRQLPALIVASSASTTLRHNWISGPGEGAGTSPCQFKGTVSLEGPNHTTDNTNCPGFQVAGYDSVSGLDILESVTPLPAGSPLIDAGNPAFCIGDDQRRRIRPVDGNGNGLAICDIGPYEFGSEISDLIFAESFE